MKSQQIKLYFLPFLIFYLSFFTTGVDATSVDPFIIITEDWAPYNFQEDGITKGISTDILLLMLERTGEEFPRNNIQIYPWNRAYKIAQKKANSILLSTTRTKEREHLFKWVGPIFELKYNLYASKHTNIKISSFKDIVKYKIGTLRGDVVEEMLIQKAGMKLSDFEQVSTNIQNTKKLARGRIKLVAQTRDTTIATCKEAKLNCQNLEDVFTISKQSIYYAFHKDTPDSIIEKFQIAFYNLKKEGKIAEIFNEYGKEVR